MLKDMEMSGHQQGEHVEQRLIDNGNQVKVKQLIPSEFSQKSKHQTTKQDAVTRALMFVFESRVIDVLPILSFFFLTYNVVDALFKANGDYRTISFVVFSYTNLIALFCCVKSFEELSEGESPKKTWLKVAIWILATSLNVSFSCRVTSIVEDSVVMSSFVWTLAIVTTVVPFMAFLWSQRKKN